MKPEKSILKAMAVLMLTGLFALLFTCTALAEDDPDGAEAFYLEQYKNSGAEGLGELLPDDTARLLYELGLDPSSPIDPTRIKSDGLLSTLAELITDALSPPLRAVGAILGLLLIIASVRGLSGHQPQDKVLLLITFVAAATLLWPCIELIGVVGEAVQTLSAFMLGFVPIYGAITVSMGRVATGEAFSTLLLLAAEGISQLTAFGLIPLSSAALCLGICGGISPIPTATRLAEWIKKSALWGMGIAVTVFSWVLGMGGPLLAAGDSLSLRTSKAVLSTTLPIMGTAVAEALSTAKGCLSLLRSGVGIYGAAAVLLLALPVIIQLALWRIALWLCVAFAEILDERGAVALFKSVDFALAVLLGCICFTALLFIISLTVGIGAV